MGDMGSPMIGLGQAAAWTLYRLHRHLRHNFWLCSVQHTSNRSVEPMGTPQQQAAAAVANLLGRIGRFAVAVGVGGGILQSSLYTGDIESFIFNFGQLPFCPDVLDRIIGSSEFTRSCPVSELCMMITCSHACKTHPAVSYAI